MSARVFWAFVVLAASATVVDAEIKFSDVTAQTGITFVHSDGGSGRRYLIETMSAGVAVFDFDRDGLVDIYFLSGAPLRGADMSVKPTNALYRNLGDMRFADVTASAGVGDAGFGLGVAVGDYNNDGFLDLFVNNAGPNVLYRNNGDGTFSDVTAHAGVSGGEMNGAGANFLDIDGDGWLDLFAANYVAWSYEAHTERYFGSWMVYPGPRDYDRTPNLLFRNSGDGTFADVSKSSGIGEHVGAGMGTVAADIDNDGDTDIIVANDDWGNFLFRNDGNGHFEEVGLSSGLAYDINGAPQSSMGVTSGDYNNDGWLDIEMTSYQTELATLYENIQGEFFDDVTRATGAGSGTLVDVTWGNGFADFDNDGDRDLFVACGHVNDNVEKFSDVATYAARNVVLENDGSGKFTDVSEVAGLSVKAVSRGAAFDDLDNDGDIDVVVLNSRAKPTVLRNDNAAGNWVVVQLKGVNTNRDGIGAHVRVAAGGKTQLAEVHSGQGYQSHYGLRLHFGLGNADSISKIEVRWIGGETETVDNPPANQIITIVEGKGIVAGSD